MTGAGACLPPTLEQELVAEYNAIAEELRPQTTLERRYVEQAAIGSLRCLHTQATLRARADRRSRRTLRAWDRKRRRRVEAALRRLAADPAGALARLSEMAEGCDALHDEWDALRQALEADGHWETVQAERALRLLGEAGLPTLASAAAPAELWLAALAAREAPDPWLLRLFFADPSAEASWLPPAAEARAALLALAAAEMARWAAEGDRLWEEHDRSERQSAVEAALADLGPESARLRRYQGDGISLMYRSLRELTAHRKEQARIAKAGGLPPPQVVRVPPGPPRENEAIWTAPMPAAQKPQVISPNKDKRESHAGSAGKPTAPDRPEKVDPAAGGPADRPIVGGDRPGRPERK